MKILKYHPHPDLGSQDKARDSRPHADDMVCSEHFI